MSTPFPPRTAPTLIAASVGCAFTVLDTNVVGIALPLIGRDLGARFADLQWVVASYALCFAALLLPAGSVADRFGRKRTLLGGIALFGVASLLCGSAWSPSTLSAARALQGVGAAFLLSPALATIGHVFHDEAERGRAWATWGGIMGLTMAVSPILGGIVAGSLGWRWAFFINAPLCAALAAAVALLIEESHGGRMARLDPAGIGLFALSMFGVTWGLVSGQGQGWTSGSALLGFTVGAAGLAAFVRVERARASPMLDLSLFRSRPLVGAVTAMFAYASCAQVMASLLPQLLQNGLGRSPLEAGFGMLPFALAMLAFPYAGRRLPAATSGPTLVTGLAVVAVGCAATSLGAHLGTPIGIAAGMFVLGAGGGLLNGETQKAIMGALPRERAGMASGLGTTARFSGILLGYAFLTAVLATGIKGALASDPTFGAAFADALAAGGVDAAVREMSPQPLDWAMARARTAYADGFAALLAVAAAAAACAALAVHRLNRGRKGAPWPWSTRSAGSR